MRNQTKSVWRKFTACFLTVAFVGGLMQTSWLPTAEAAVSGSSPLRVGLMMKAGSINTTDDTVTLQGREGLKVGFYKDGSFASVYSASTAVKASLDNYYVVVGEYDTLAQAQAMADKVDGLGKSFDIYLEVRSGKNVYQVINGFFETKAQADTALADCKQRLGSGVLAGYLRLTTGKVADSQTAQTKADELRGQGFAAYPLVRRDGSWEVWIGNEASTTDLETLRGQVKVKFNVVYTNADYRPGDYLMIKKSAFGTQEIPHFIQNSSVEEVAFVPQGSPAVTKIYEKAREYRGSILVQGYNEKPNVINYVPLDQYLYGVVPQEMASGWPMEALKAQAVAARTYAAKRLGGKKWGVADLSDDVWDQAYRGFGREATDTNQAVDATKGQVVLKNGAYIDALYSSNNGGYNGDVREMWNSSVDYLTAVESPFDRVAQDREPMCYRVQLPNGQIGWMRETNVSKTGKKNTAGFEYATVNKDDEPVRYVPDFYAKVMTTASSGSQVIILEQEKEYNTYNWQRGPYSPTEMMNMINSNQASGYTTVSEPVYNLLVSKWGQGNRVVEITADGKALDVPSPDYYRALFNDMWSTRMTIEQQGSYTVLGANGQKSEYPSAKQQGKAMNVITASGTATTAINGSNSSFVVMGASNKSRIVTKEQSYVLHGYGWGHGLGMSQWGARGMAENGYTYDRILQHYYQGITLTAKQ